jgi:putative proteasome-type protease
MTYCVGLRLDQGLVFGSDTRTNAGFDNISIFRKMHIWERPLDRVIVLLTAGNLSVSQSVISKLNEAIDNAYESGTPAITSAETMFQVARMVGEAIREVRAVDGEALEAGGGRFSASFILGGQIQNEPSRLFQIYSEGNFIEATKDTPFFQIGEHKYGKPVLDRVTRPDMTMGEAAKAVLLSFDSTLRSNLSVGMPIDLLLYNRDTLKLGEHRRIDADDAYFQRLSAGWEHGLRDAFDSIESYPVER